ncbi:MAG: glycosyltransferase [Alphaproteobacteria bacterium]|nr:MAG: glycosyltransferase [Alphaproteobacteria bacterium]
MLATSRVVGPRMAKTHDGTLRVLHVITGLNVGGAERMLQKVLVGMNSDRFQNHVVTLLRGGKIASEIRALGIPVYELGLLPLWPSPTGLYRLIRITRRIAPQVIQGWMYHGNCAAWLAWRAAGGKAFLSWNIRQSLYDLNKEKTGTRLAIRLGTRIQRNVRRIIYNSNVSRLQHEAVGYRADLAEVIPNGFDTEGFRPDPRAGLRLRSFLGVSPEAVLIGLIARYHPMKGHATFLAAAARLVDCHPQARFVLVGTGIDEGNASLMQEVIAAGLRERTYLLGERSDVAALIAGLDIVCSSASWGEGFPNVVGEAMSCGVPCVVTDVGDCAAIVGETGWVVSPGDPEALAAALKAAVEAGCEARRARGQQARARVIECYALPQIARRYEQLYAQLSADR